MENVKQVREDFINSLSETQQKGFKLLFKKFNNYEKKTGKVFEEFDKDEFNKFVIDELIMKSANSTLVKVSLCRKYADYLGIDCVQLRRNDVMEMCEKYFKEQEVENESQLKYVSFEEVKLATNKITNEIDVALVMLLRMGVSGNKFSELINLKTKDIDIENRKIYLKDRVVDIEDDFALQVLKDAMKQTTYTVLLHGEDKNIPKVLEYDFNMSCPYFFKQKMWAKNNNGMNKYGFSGMTGKVFRVMQELGMDISAINLLQSYATDRILKFEEEVGHELSIRECKEYLRHIKNSCNSYDIKNITLWVKGNK